MNWVRGNIFIPDPKIYWVKPSIKYLNKKIQEEESIDYIVSTGPPHSMHLIALGFEKDESKKLNGYQILEIRGQKLIY